MQRIFLLVTLWGGFAHANVVGNGHQNFNTIPSGLDFVTVHSSETLKPGIINFGLYLNYGVNSLPYFEGSDQKRTNFNDTLTAIDLNVGIGITKNFDIGLSLPGVISQSVRSDQNFHGEFLSPGNTEARLLGKYRFYGEDDGGAAVVASVNYDRTKDNPYMGSNPGLIYNLELAMDRTINRWAVGGNIGYRWINSGAAIAGTRIEPLGNQLIASAAASYLLSRVDTKVIFELFGSMPAKSAAGNANRSASSAEFLVGLKHDYSHSTAFHAGGATELQQGVSSPDWRLYVGINYTLGPVFNKPQPIAQPAEEKIVLQSVLFDFDSDTMVGEFESILSEVATALRKKPFKKVVISGHTDSIGSENYNNKLSSMRATAIRSYLIKNLKFAEAELEASGKGEIEPVADNGNFQGRQQNRRVEFTIVRD